MTADEADGELTRALKQLRTTDMALADRRLEQPVIVFRHGRWHMLSIGWVSDPAMRLRRGIRSVHFMARRRAEQTIAAWLPFSEVRPFETICPAFAEELAAKVLPTAEAYRPLVKQGWVVLVGGHTADALMARGAADEPAEALIASIGEWMRRGPVGPFLHFTRSYQVLRGGAA